MKHLTILLSVLILISCNNNKNEELKLTNQIGTGGFQVSFSMERFYDQTTSKVLKKFQFPVDGIPSDWSEIRRTDIETNIFQTVYQNYSQGILTSKEFTSYQRGWNWQPDSLILSDIPLRTRVAVVMGKSPNGERLLIIDSNNNRDLSDEKAFAPLPFGNFKSTDSIFKENYINVEFDYYENGTVHQQKIALVLAYYEKMDRIACSIPTYYTTSLDETTLNVKASLNGYSRYNKAEVTIPNLSSSYSNIIKQNEFIEINQKLYENIGIDNTTHHLVLNLCTTPKHELFSTQIGYKLKSFEGYDILSDSLLSTDRLENEYTFIKFWSPRCAPCLEELPEIVELSSSELARNTSFVSIVANTNNKQMLKLINEYSISTPQILSTKENDLFERYNLRGYPHSFLIDKDGIIIAKNLRGENLNEKLKEINASR